jgi:hypothetical protein
LRSPLPIDYNIIALNPRVGGWNGYLVPARGNASYAAGVAGMRAIAWIAFALSASAILFCSYSFLYFAWLTATPLASAQLVRVRYSADVWPALAGLSVVATIVSLVLAIRLGRPKVLTGFEVLPISDGPGAE